MAGFREMVDVCGLYDLGYEGRMWTFEKKVAGGSYCRVRLDRALVSSDWGVHIPQAKVRHLTAASLDHDPILLRWEQDRRGRHGRKKKMFKYELMWESHEEFVDMLAQTWQGAGAAYTL